MRSRSKGVSEVRPFSVNGEGFFFVCACRIREFISDQYSMHPFMPERKAFWTDESTNFIERRKNLNLEAVMR